MEGTCELNGDAKLSSPEVSGTMCSGLNTMATIVPYWWQNKTLTLLIGCDVTSIKLVALRCPAEVVGYEAMM